MKQKYYILTILLLLTGLTYGQDVLTLTPWDGSATTELFTQIIADSAADGGIKPNRVYELTAGQVYAASQTFYVENENTLNLRSSGDEHAIIYLIPTGAGDNPQNPPGYFVRTRGGDLVMTGIALSGYLEPVDENFYNIQGGMLRSDNEGSSFIIDNCIFSNTRGQVLRTNASTVKVEFTNCILTNLGSLAGSNLGAGKGLDLRDVSCGELILVNNTFTNYQDRIVRHYNFGNPLEGTGDIGKVVIDHNTFYSGMGFHGTLSLGNVGPYVRITNNLLVDAFSAGEDSTDATRTAEWANNGEFYGNGNSKMSWIFTAQNDSTNWVVENNFYSISDAGQGFFDAHEEIGEGSPLSDHINLRLGAKSLKAFTKIDDPGFTNAQDLILNIMEYYVDPAGGNKTKETGPWVREEDDMDRRPLSFWMNDFDISYSAASIAYAGAKDGYPAGNLNAYPDLKADWENGVVQEDVLALAPWDGTPATELFAQIIADSAADGSLKHNRVYELTAGQAYAASQTFYVENENTLNLRSSSDEHAIIYLIPTGAGDNPQNPPGYFVRTRGGDLVMTGIALSGYLEPVDENFYNIQGGMLRSDNEGSSFIIDNCIFSNTRGQVLRTNASTVTVKFTDCILTNLGSLAGSNLGAGKGLDLRDVSCGELILVNNTFTNYQDRVVRHYNFGNPLEGTGDIDRVVIDHNTFYSGMGFHGTLSLGNVGLDVRITNNLLVDAFSAGEDSTDATRTAEWANNGEFYGNGNSKMSWIFTAQNETTTWNVKNNYYAISNEGQAFFDAHAEIGEGSPLSDHIKARLGDDAAAAFTKIDDPGFTNAQDLILNIMEYYVDPAGGNKTKETGPWVREEDDMDRRPLSFWMNDFDVSYPTLSVAYTGAEDGYPAGDLNAFPDKKGDWITGIDDKPADLLPSKYSLSQNYPNPFNPSTIIRYNLPARSNVSLKVYDVLGSEVATLLNNSSQNVGQHEVNFDASRLSSGIYFYTLTTGKFVQTKKMMLIK
jgi:type IX secretion system substrate protein